MAYYYVETDFGCGIREYTNIQQATKQEKAKVGWAHFKSIRKATDKDINWVRRMGGALPAGLNQ